MPKIKDMEIIKEIMKLENFMEEIDSPYHYTNISEHIEKVNGDISASFVLVKNFDDIHEKKTKYLNFAGVYFIYVKNPEYELYYIGESENIFSRLKDHFIDSSKLFLEEDNIDKNNIIVTYIDTRKKNKLYRLAIEGVAYIIAEESDSIKCHERLLTFNGDKYECKQKETLTDKKKSELKEFLLKPIIVESNCATRLENDIIKSSQKYYGNDDPDMSDLAIEFYKELYDIDVLDGSRIPFSKFGSRIAGDTMNSFNTIAKKLIEILELDFDQTCKISQFKKKKLDYNKETLEYQTLEKIIKFEGLYHCLANFWVIDFNHGRLGPKKTYSASKNQDYMDRYLGVVFDEKSSNIHFCDCYYEGNLIKSYSKSLVTLQEINDCISYMIDNIILRAEEIANSPKGFKIFKNIYENISSDN